MHLLVLFLCAIVSRAQPAIPGDIEKQYDFYTRGISWGAEVPPTSGPCTPCALNGHITGWETVGFGSYYLPSYTITFPQYANLFQTVKFQNTLNAMQATSNNWVIQAEISGSSFVKPRTITNDEKGAVDDSDKLYLHTPDPQYLAHTSDDRLIFPVRSTKPGFSYELAPIAYMASLYEYNTIRQWFDYSMPPAPGLDYGVFFKNWDGSDIRPDTFTAGVKSTFYYLPPGALSEQIDICNFVHATLADYQFLCQKGDTSKSCDNPNDAANGANPFCDNGQDVAYNVEYDQPNGGMLMCIPAAGTGSAGAARGYEMYIPFNGNSSVLVGRTVTAQARCNVGYGGHLCDQPVPHDFNPDFATSCPDPTVFDLCSGRGHCRVKPGGVGIYCRCARGWFGNSSFVQFYAMDSECAGQDVWGIASAGSILEYAKLHQCLYFIGPPNPYNWNMSYAQQLVGDTVYISTPTPHPYYSCANNQVARDTQGVFTLDYQTIDEYHGTPINLKPNTDDTHVYGGLHCSRCPPCDPVNSYGCFARVTNKNTSDHRTCYCGTRPDIPGGYCPDSCAIEEGDHTLECVCKTGYTGLCVFKSCPVSDDDVQHGAGLPCSEHLGHGVCHLDLHSKEYWLEKANQTKRVQYDDNIIIDNFIDIQNSPVDGQPLIREYFFNSSSAKFELTNYAGRCACKKGYTDDYGSCSKFVCPADYNGNVCANGYCLGSRDCPNIPIPHLDTTIVKEAPLDCPRLNINVGCYSYSCPPYYGSVNPNGDCYMIRDYDTCVSGGECYYACKDLPRIKDVYTRCGTLFGLPQSENTTSVQSLSFTDNLVRDYCRGRGCYCDPYHDLDPVTGLCTFNKCPVAPNGLVCNGLTVAAGWETPDRPIGSNICRQGVAEAECPCYEAVPKVQAPNSVSLAGRFYNDGVFQACTLTYTSVCAPVNGVACNQGGSCYPTACLADNGASWDNCTQNSVLLRGPPTCNCLDTVTGVNCDRSKCGGFSPSAPCSLGNLGQVITGECIKDGSAYRCRCTHNQITGAPYIGPNCEIEAVNCTTPPAILATTDIAHLHLETFDSRLRIDVCSGAGACGRFYPPDGFGCSCDANYGGTVCETENNCIPSCPIARGKCKCAGATSSCPGTGECVCYANYDGAQCATSVCTDTGGTEISPSECDCSVVNGVQYPNIHTNPAHLDTSFKGCRRMCAAPATGLFQGLECGGLAQGNYSRCSSGVIAANSPAPGVPGCDCSVLAPNPLAPQYTAGSSSPQAVTWISVEDGTCEPKCLHCFESVNGCELDQCPNPPCQYGGARCNTTRCNGAATYNGTACECHPSWLYPPSNTACDYNALTVCDDIPGFSAKPLEADLMHAQACNCTFPYIVQSDPAHPRFRLCVSACGPHGTPNQGTSSCECNDIHSGTYCNVSMCASGITVSNDGTTCQCGAYPQWGGTLCATNQCVGGSPRAVPDVGCNCYGIFIGDLCETSRCVFGHPSSMTSPSALCVCDPGYSGTLCTESSCDYGVKPEAAATSLGYTCDCGSVGVFNPTTGHCDEVNCNNGVVTYVQANNSLVCVCDKGYIGLQCDALACPEGQRNFNYFNHTTGEIITRVCACDVYNTNTTTGVDYNCLATECLTQLQQLGINLPNALQADRMPEPYRSYYQGSRIVKWSSVSGDGTDCACSDDRYIPYVITGAPYPTGFTVFFGCWRRCAPPEAFSAFPRDESDPYNYSGLYLFHHPDKTIAHLDPDHCDCAMAQFESYPAGLGGPACDGEIHVDPPVPPVNPPYDPVRDKNTTTDPTSNISMPALPADPDLPPPINPDPPPHNATIIHPISLQNITINISSQNTTDARPVPTSPMGTTKDTHVSGLSKLYVGIICGAVALGVMFISVPLYIKYIHTHKAVAKASETQKLVKPKK